MANYEHYNVVVSNRATEMLVDHAAFLARVSVPAAERLTNEFEKVSNSLRNMPQRCPWLATEFIPANKYRFLVFEKRYMIIFKIEDDTVFIDCIVDCRQFGLPNRGL